MSRGCCCGRGHKMVAEVKLRRRGRAGRLRGMLLRTWLGTNVFRHDVCCGRGCGWERERVLPLQTRPRDGPQRMSLPWTHMAA